MEDVKDKDTQTPDELNPVVEEVSEHKSQYEKLRETVRGFRKKGSVTEKLERPLLAMGKEVTELTLNFDKLTPMDLIDAESQWMMIFGGGMSPSPMNSTSYRLVIAAKAAGIPVEDLINSKTGLSARDTIGIASVVLAFLTPLD